MTAPPTIPDSVLKMIPLLSSDRPGEVAAAAAAIDRALRKAGCDWHDLTRVIGIGAKGLPAQQPQSSQRYSGDRPWQAVAQACLASATRFSAKEKAFLQDMADWHAQPSQKQLDWLASLHKKIGRDWSDIS